MKFKSSKQRKKVMSILNPSSNNSKFQDRMNKQRECGHSEREKDYCEHCETGMRKEDYPVKKLNKSQVEEKFKNSKSIKKTINDYKSIDEQREEIKSRMKEQNIPESEFSEDEKSFHVGNVGIFKNEKDKVSYVDKLPYDVKGKNIKEYGNNYVKTDYATYELDYSSNIPTDKDNPNSTADYFLGNDPKKTDYYKQQAKMNR